MNDSNNATEALRRLLAAMLDEDATIRNRGEAYDNLHDHVLDACRHAGVPLPKPASPARRVLKEWNVYGTVHLAGGFDINVTATDKEAARRYAINVIQDEDGERPPLEWGCQIQEVCVNDVQELPGKENAA